MICITSQNNALQCVIHNVVASVRAFLVQWTDPSNAMLVVSTWLCTNVVYCFDDSCIKIVRNKMTFEKFLCLMVVWLGDMWPCRLCFPNRKVLHVSFWIWWSRLGARNPSADYRINSGHFGSTHVLFFTLRTERSVQVAIYVKAEPLPKRPSMATAPMVPRSALPRCYWACTEHRSSHSST